ncbi:restriction endonuclease subunit S [Pseudomonas putida]|uniref:restriction endonuclease subunit S n=1 Tax=Pseudomonas putida TaxID=303 RepID=UPI003905D09D
MSWSVKMLGDLVDIKGGGTPSKSVPEYWGGSIPWASVKDFKGGTLEKTDDYITELAVSGSSTNVIPAGSVIVPTRMALGKVAINAVDMAINQDLKALQIRDGSKLLGRYLYRFLESKAQFLEGQGKGATVKGITLDVLKGLEIPLPPLPEQKRIAAILDKADAIRRKRQQAIQLADDFLRAVFEDMFGDPVNNPKGFPIGTIRDLVATADYGTSAKASEAYGEYPILRMGNITYQGRIDLKDLKYIDLDGKDKSKYLASKGDLLFNRTNSKELVGKTAVYDMDDPVAIAGYLIRVRPNERGNNYYIAGYLNSVHGKGTLKSVCKSIVGMANINAQEMQNIPIMLPPVEMQRRYQELVVATKCKLMKINSSLTVMEALFSSVSHQGLSGKL